MTAPRTLLVPAVLLLHASILHAEPRTIPLWEGGAPGFEHLKDEPEQAQSYWVRNIHNPSITAYLPPSEIATGAAVVIAPGGGHRELVFNAEGREAAEFLNGIGVAAFALKYRLGREEGSPYDVREHAGADGRRAVRLVRSRAAEWGIDPERIGMMGFSAGGEVVSMAAFGPAEGDPAAEDPADRYSARPDFIIQIYPGSLGIPERVPADAPPAFLLVANDDFGAARSIYTLIDRYREAGAIFEAHLLARGGHAFNMGNRSDLRTLRGWPERMEQWMADNFILDPAGKAEYDEQVAQQRERMRRFRERARQRQQQGGRE